VKSAPESLRLGRSIFITGTDTGVGKTILTSLLLIHLRRRGYRAWAMKPFCTGPRRDARLLASLQDEELSLNQINPFHFRAQLAPLAAARRQGKNVQLEEVMHRILMLQSRCECLLIEGVGGLLAPLGEGYTVAEVIAALGCEVIIAAPNRLGIINQASLTVRTLQRIGAQSVKIVLMGSRQRSLATLTNPAILAELLAPCAVFCLPHFRLNLKHPKELEKIAEKFQKTLALLAGCVRLGAVVARERPASSAKTG
jgi:dethiobiotin synthetase